MTEPTGIPLLDRLDALLPEGDWFDFGLAAEEPGPLWECDDLTKRVAIGLFKAYPELRRLVLQYRAERDQCESARHQYRKFLVGIIHERDQLQRRCDALVEALKKLLEDIDSVRADELGGGPVSPSLVHDARAKLLEKCPHLSWTGDEGPKEPGRAPRRWRCDACGVIRITESEANSDDQTE